MELYVNIYINTDNQAFEDPYELTRILQNGIQMVNVGDNLKHALYDINGNKVGSIRIVSEGEEDEEERHG